MGDTPQWKMRISHLDPSTQETYSRICRRYGVSDDTTWADISKHVEKIRNPNTKRSVIGALITCLGTKEGAPKQPRPVPKVYDLPDHCQIQQMAEQGYGAFIYAMAYAGLRVGEAVALRPEDLGKSGSRPNPHSRCRRRQGRDWDWPAQCGGKCLGRLWRRYGASSNHPRHSPSRRRLH